MSETKTRPCVYPGCRDHEGNPTLTDRVICGSSRRHYRRLLDWIVLDWVTLKHAMPTPTGASNSGSKHLSPKSKSFGHPAEWASVTTAEIADALNWAEDGLRDLMGHAPPPHPGVREAGRVAHAHAYLTSPRQFDALCTYDAAEDTAIELNDLHRKVRSLLGQNRRVERLPTPCPWCDIAALVRDVDQVECRACGKTVEEKHYTWFAGFLIDQMIADYDRAQESA